MTFFSDFSISATLLWVVAGLVLGAAEILVGTFYLLVVAVSALLAAAAAWAGATVGWQFTVFAVAMIAGGLAVRRLRLRQGAADHEADSLQNPDRGQRVEVKTWDADGTALVNYRGAQWRVRLADGIDASARTPGRFEIVSVDGAALIVRPKAQ